MSSKLVSILLWLLLVDKICAEYLFGFVSITSMYIDYLSMRACGGFLDRVFFNWTVESGNIVDT